MATGDLTCRSREFRSVLGENNEGTDQGATQVDTEQLVARIHLDRLASPPAHTWPRSESACNKMSTALLKSSGPRGSIFGIARHDPGRKSLGSPFRFSLLSGKAFPTNPHPRPHLSRAGV